MLRRMRLCGATLMAAGLLSACSAGSNVAPTTAVQAGSGSQSAATGSQGAPAAANSAVTRRDALAVAQKGDRFHASLPVAPSSLALVLPTAQTVTATVAQKTVVFAASSDPKIATVNPEYANVTMPSADSGTAVFTVTPRAVGKAVIGLIDAQGRYAVVPVSVSVAFGYTGSSVSYTIPASGTYTIVAYGAQGGTDSAMASGGLGAQVGGDFRLSAGETLSIAVGGSPPTGNASGGGGGGSFVVAPNNKPLVIAGAGGGGGGTGFNGDSGQSGTAGSAGGGAGGAGGTGGTGGAGGLAGAGGGGGGFTSGGGYGSGPGGANGGGGYPGLAGGAGGPAGADGGDGAFGGGGGGGGAGGAGGGGGGGYSGGGGGGAGAGGGGTLGGGGGGGGSFDGGTNRTLVSGGNSGNGSVVITPH